MSKPRTAQRIAGLGGILLAVLACSSAAPGIQAVVDGSSRSRDAAAEVAKNQAAPRNMDVASESLPRVEIEIVPLEVEKGTEAFECIGQETREVL